MRLLICAQKVDKNDPVLGFFHRWIEEFAKHCERVHVICIEEGECGLPENVFVHSLGKERGVNRVSRTVRFYRCITSLQDEYDAVFVHREPAFVVLGGVLWRLWKKRIGLWYANRTITLKLRLAALLAHRVFSPAPSGFRIQTDKARFVGHGIDTRGYGVHPSLWEEELQLLHVGRIMPEKNCEVILHAAHKLQQSRPLTLTFVGGPVTRRDRQYEQRLRQLSKQLGIRSVVFLGKINHPGLREIYSRMHISVNASRIGGLDKVVFESMAAGCIPLTSNGEFRNYFGAYADRLLFQEDDADDLASKIDALIKCTDQNEIGSALSESVRKEGDVSSLIPRILFDLA